ncbi:MAG: 4-hydroxybenzoate octaprenyltransferase [Alphaproteobacteria bacterium]|nr:MAG: 4-hydroxybenzoate octaprenyltransferase [Alphaproteobacteria bacterium]
MATDINTDKLVFRITPPRFHPYVKLARLDRPIGTWLLLFPCWWSIALASGGLPYMTSHEWSLALRFAIGAVLMRAAGCVVNDLWDRELDAQVERTRTRPLPAGEVTPRQAMIFLGLLLGASFLILITLNIVAILLGLLSLSLVGAYPLMKRITWWPQLFLGFTFNWGALMGWAAIKGTLGLPAFYLYLAGILWTLAYDTIYAHQDKEDDLTVGIKSTALLWAENSTWFVGICFFLCIFFLFITKLFAADSPYMLLLTMPVIAQAIWQLLHWDMKSPESCLEIFKSNAFFGWLVLFMLGM